MNDEQTPEVNIEKAAQDLANEKLANETKQAESQKLSALEQELAKYKQQEAESLKAAEEAKKDEVHKRLEELEQARLKDKEDYESKLTKLSERQTSGKVVGDKKLLSKEDYLANKSQYDAMLARHIVENKGM